MKHILSVALLTLASLPSFAVDLSLSDTADIEFYPVANNCGLEEYRKGTEGYADAGGFKITQGYELSCSLPIKPGRYLERILVDYTVNMMAPRGCKVGFTYASGADVPTNNMLHGRYNNSNYWYFDDLGAADKNLVKQNTLLMTCVHHTFREESFVRYGVIRVEYTPE